MDIQFLSGDIAKVFNNFYHSGFFLTVRILLGIYVAVLFVDIILLLIHRGLGGTLREHTTGMDIPLAFTKNKNKTRIRWEEIKRRLETNNENEYKIAIIEADDFIGDLVAGLGYEGENFGERLDNIPEGQIANVEGMKMAHETKNKIVLDEHFSVTKEVAVETLGQFDEFLRSFQIID